MIPLIPGKPYPHDIIEAIAIQWFTTASYPPLRFDTWESQPDEIKAMHRECARTFMQNPSRTARKLHSVLHELDQLLVDYRRGYIEGIPNDATNPLAETDNPR